MKLLNIEIKKAFIPFIIIFLFSFLFLFGKDGGLGIFLGIFSLLIAPLALIKPTMAFPFLTNVNRKQGLGIALALFIAAIVITPTSSSSTTKKEIVVPTTKEEVQKVTVTIVKSSVGESESAVKPTVSKTPTPLVTKKPTATNIPPTNTPIPWPTNTPYVPLPTATPIPVQQQANSGGNCKYTCNGADKDCKDFSSHDEAQAFFNCCGFSVTNDPMQLDGLGVDDGLACESI